MSGIKDKYFSIMGDSISTYEGYIPEGYPAFYSFRMAYSTGVYGYRDTWWGQVLEHFRAKLLINNSWSGSCVCRAPECETESYACSDSRTSGLGNEELEPDHIIIYIGTNDRGWGFPLASTDRGDLCVIENAYALMLDKIRKNYPRAELWCCTFPITACTRDPYYEFPKTNRGIPMECYGEMIKKLAVEKGCHIIDLWDTNELCDTVDGLHPSYAGMSMIANKVIAAMSLDKETDN